MSAASHHPDPIRATVTELRRRLPLPLRPAGLLAEIEDGLSDAAEAYRRAGLPADQAAAAAVRDFGPVETTVADCGTAGAARLVRITARAMIIGYLVSTAAWASLMTLQPDRWQSHGIDLISFWFLTLGLIFVTGGWVLLRRLRRAARQHRSVATTALAAAATAIACCALTLGSSYAVAPWQTSPLVPGGIREPHDVVELISGGIQLIILGAGASCLIAAHRLRRLTRPETAAR
ncbi:MAG TPA: permease prefix domain 1-containing protein [Microlunatus sp.]|nr:permease prefix domain 1-containing protein [Microlunatus sp.]